jgi:hypothetical protein
MKEDDDELWKIKTDDEVKRDFTFWQPDEKGKLKIMPSTVSGAGTFVTSSFNSYVTFNGYQALYKNENGFHPSISVPNCSKPELSESDIEQYDNLLIKIKDLPVFCFSVSDLEFILEKPLMVNGKTTNDCYFYTYQRLNRLKKLISVAKQ